MSLRDCAWIEGAAGALKVAEGGARRDGVPPHALRLRCRPGQRREAPEEVEEKKPSRRCHRADAFVLYPSSATLLPTHSCRCTLGLRSRIAGEMRGLECVSRATRYVQHRHILYSESELSDTTPWSATDASSRSGGSPLGNAALAGSFGPPGGRGEQQAFKVSLRGAPPVMP